MKGIERTLDNLGRVVIPSEFRKELGIESNSKVIIMLSDGEIIIKGQKASCALCGEKIDKTKSIRLSDKCISKVRLCYAQ